MVWDSNRTRSAKRSQEVTRYLVLPWSPWVPSTKWQKYVRFLLFYEMARYRRRPRYFRRRTANYTVQRRLLQSNSWAQSTVDPQHWIGTVKLLENHMDSDLDPTSSGICTIKHLQCDIVKRPFFKFRTQWDNHYNYEIPAVAWAIVYVPQGTHPSPPFGGTVQNNNMAVFCASVRVSFGRRFRSQPPT